MAKFVIVCVFPARHASGITFIVVLAQPMFSEE